MSTGSVGTEAGKPLSPESDQVQNESSAENQTINTASGQFDVASGVQHNEEANQNGAFSDWVNAPEQPYNRPPLSTSTPPKLTDHFELNQNGVVPSQVATAKRVEAPQAHPGESEVSFHFTKEEVIEVLKTTHTIPQSSYALKERQIVSQSYINEALTNNDGARIELESALAKNDRLQELAKINHLPIFLHISKPAHYAFMMEVLGAKEDELGRVWVDTHRYLKNYEEFLIHLCIAHGCHDANFSSMLKSAADASNDDLEKLLNLQPDFVAKVRSEV
ncbi:hypothetical protein D5018_19300 [Parashewanella curva]|uniref:Uncharacterized protein n=1 Tax=Parashewanella curva TaxID=2338552 RepID=A0A3L8PS39_9GAMM|nr:hypothetical protein [Parashewanella curva]RLV58054.1 hypothetical protein D5018_19300 [Parashewanella curva]